jgi:hypothetical protein
VGGEDVEADSGCLKEQISKFEFKKCFKISTYAKKCSIPLHTHILILPNKKGTRRVGKYVHIHEINSNGAQAAESCL